VRKNERLGFSGFLTVSETATTFEEYVRFVGFAAHDANGRQVVIHHASFNTLAENVASTRRTTAAGASAVLLSYPATLFPRTMDEVECYTSEFCRSVDKAVILLAFERLHPASLPIDVLERLVDELPNVVAIKAEGGYPSMAGFVEVWRRLHDGVVVTMPLEHHAIPLATLVEMPFIGTSNGE
jgi:4-hydroxy-tetrahydrodipicolinate synthase